jgi:hypothetical protein
VLTDVLRLPAWHRYAACAGRAALFYDTAPTAQRIAAAVCQGCGVRGACLADALADERRSGCAFGVGGGLTATERVDRSHIESAPSTTRRRPPQALRLRL